jgi:hypothetical protein
MEESGQWEVDGCSSRAAGHRCATASRCATLVVKRRGKSRLASDVGPDGFASRRKKVADRWAGLSGNLVR